MSKNTVERQKRRPVILNGLSQDLKQSEIATKLGVNRWVIMNDVRYMQYYGDPELKEAMEAQKQIQEKKHLASIREKKYAIHNERFQNMTGMTLKEKSFRNMINFHKRELMKILKSKDQNSAIMRLPKSTRRTLIHNEIITKGWHTREISSHALKYLPSYDK